MTTHVFIVNEETFPLHLQYMFAGTGAGDSDVDFNNNANNTIPQKNLVGMMADASRVKVGDKVIFYCQANKSDGKFYGVFKVKQESFLEQNPLTPVTISKKLIFRTLLEPDEVFEKGVTEWEALDCLENIEKPQDIIWSLVYRKLGGYRGNTMITDKESERLISLIKGKNNSTPLASSGYTYSSSDKKIIPGESLQYNSSNAKAFNILPRLTNSHYSFEAFLQTYLLQKIDKDAILKNLLLDNRDLLWIGNEVMCGFGMRRIDILLASVDNLANTFLSPIELKACTIYPEIIDQLDKYYVWVNQYYRPIPNGVAPIIITKRSTRRTDRFDASIERIKEFNEKYDVKIKYIVYNVSSDDISFDEVNYDSL